MTRLNVVDLRHSLADVLNRAEYRGERIIVHRRGKDAAAIISIEDLRLFERLVSEAEDKLDEAAAQAALAEPGERIPYSEYRRRRLEQADGQAEEEPAETAKPSGRRRASR
jgi:prevent-host-death family protein